MTETIFVLGAGFTKAFLSKAPLLVDDYGGNELKERFAKFQDAKSILEMELLHKDHANGLINLERLMTRLAGGMPYDIPLGADKSLDLLLSSVMESFVKRIQDARASGIDNQGELERFVKSCFKNGNSCITFNYDDLLDEVFYGLFSGTDPRRSWSPDWGYGFPCQPSEACITGPQGIPGGPAPATIFKLHGSMNWRIPRRIEWRHALLAGLRPGAIGGLHCPWPRGDSGHRCLWIKGGVASYQPCREPGPS